MVRIEWQGAVEQIDRFPDGATRLAFIASMLTTSEMRRLFAGNDARDVCKSLAITYKSRESETSLCNKIWEYYHG